MVLAPELLQFAENFYRRFPEEFIALGAPGLEQMFDLRVDGSRSRRMSDTPTEKTVEITIRRWQPPPQQGPYGAYPQQGMYPGLPSPPVSTAFPRPWSPGPGSGPPQAAGPMPNDWARAAAGYGGPPAAGPPGYGAQQQQQQQQPPPQQSLPAGPSPVEAQMASQLARLESALSSMMPQVAAMLQNQHQESVAPTNHNKPAPAITFGREQVTESRRGTTPTTSSSPKAELQSPNSPLRERRHVGNIHIQPPVRVEDPGAVVPESVKAASVDKTLEQQAPTKKEKPRITAVRMMPNATDPESPRSPGRYSVWK